MANTLDFSGKVALVTGAAAGMGLATARAFAEAGAAVVLADFKEDAVKAAAAELVAAGHKAIAVRCDVARRRPGGGDGGPHRLGVRPARRRVQQRGRHGPHRTDGREHPRGMGPRHRGQPARRLELHEARAAADGTPGAAGPSSTTPRSGR